MSCLLCPKDSHQTPASRSVSALRPCPLHSSVATTRRPCLQTPCWQHHLLEGSLPLSHLATFDRDQRTLSIWTILPHWFTPHYDQPSWLALLTGSLQSASGSPLTHSSSKAWQPFQVLSISVEILESACQFLQKSLLGLSGTARNLWISSTIPSTTVPVCPDWPCSRFTFPAISCSFQRTDPVNTGR